MAGERRWIFWNRLVAGGDGYLVVAAICISWLAWEDAGQKPFGTEMAAAITAACAVAVIARWVYLRRTVTEGREVVGRVRGIGLTGRFAVDYEVDGQHYEADLSYGDLSRREARRVREVILLVDSERPENAVLTHVYEPEADV